MGRRSDAAIASHLSTLVSCTWRTSTPRATLRIGAPRLGLARLPISRSPCEKSVSGPLRQHQDARRCLTQEYARGRWVAAHLGDAETHFVQQLAQLVKRVEAHGIGAFA